MSLNTQHVQQSSLTPSCHIRRATRSDMDGVAEILRSTASWYKPISAPQDMREHDVDENWASLNFSRRDFFVAVDEQGAKVGTVSLQDAGEYAYVGYVYVLASKVGRGYGRQLLRHAKRVARDRGYRGLALIAHPDATWATRVYEKFGFEVAESEPDRVCAWNGSFIKAYYEQDFHLYLYEFQETP